MPGVFDGGSMIDVPLFFSFEEMSSELPCRNGATPRFGQHLLTYLIQQVPTKLCFIIFFLFLFFLFKKTFFIFFYFLKIFFLFFLFFL